MFRNSYQFRGGRVSSHPGFATRYKSKKAPLDPSLFVRKAVVAENLPEFVPTHTWSDFGLDTKVLQNVASKGYGKPTPIQDQVIPEVSAEKDVVGIANTGTGKTAAFLLPLITQMMKNRAKKVLIMVPTRELANQIDEEFKGFARQTGLWSAVCIGGVAMGRQISNVSRHPNFVIGTPGRLKDLASRRFLRFADYGVVVLDEVDRMLDMGFIHDMREILAGLPSVRQSLFFSATLPAESKNLIREFAHDPVFVSVAVSKTAANVEQDIVSTRGRQKIEVLHELLIKHEFSKVLVFGRTKFGMDKLDKMLSLRGFKVATIHGNKSQGQRQRALEMFKNRRVQVLLATDVAARGLDIDDVSHVINYDPPETYDEYVHRIGRTGRADKTGVALTFVE